MTKRYEIVAQLTSEWITKVEAESPSEAEDKAEIVMNELFPMACIVSLNSYEIEDND